MVKQSPNDSNACQPRNARPNPQTKHLSIQLLLVLLLSISNPIATGTALAASEKSGTAVTQDSDAQVATTWFDLYLHLIQTTDGFTPPVAARALGYAGVTLYEAVVPGMTDHQSLAGQLNDLTTLPTPEAGKTYHWPSVANSALAYITRELFINTSRENERVIHALERQLAAGFQAQADQATLDRSIEYGHTLAEAIYQWSLSDGGARGQLHNFHDDYLPPQGAGLWIPTAPKFQRSPLQPYWGDNRPFVLQNGNMCDPPPPLTYSEQPTSTFYRQAMEVYTTVQNLSAEQETIALFWADDAGRTPTPPGHSIAIVTQILKDGHASLALAAETYAKVGIVANDAFISCWRTKYTYNLIRPISYIQRVIDPTWNTPNLTDPVTTPPFPEYTSGHSVQIGAVATVLSDLFGKAYHFTDHTNDQRGFLARSFNSFDEMANEAAISRLYGGIHYRQAIEAGLAEGKCIGKQVNALKMKK
ncbi:MAG: vanadium-dependent haloperoxidase [Caldilineaceae bacterium]